MPTNTITDYAIDNMNSWKNADIQMKQRNYSNAFHLFNNIMPQTSITQFNIAFILSKLNNQIDAIKILSHSIKLDPYLAIAFYARSVCFFGLNMIESALEDMLRILHLLHSNELMNYTQLGNPFVLYKSFVYYNIALFYNHQSNPIESIAYAAKANKLSPNNIVIKEAFVRGVYKGLLGDTQLTHFQLQRGKERNLESVKYLERGIVIMSTRKSELFEKELDDGKSGKSEGTNDDDDDCKNTQAKDDDNRAIDNNTWVKNDGKMGVFKNIEELLSHYDERD